MNTTFHEEHSDKKKQKKKRKITPQHTLSHKLTNKYIYLPIMYSTQPFNTQYCACNDSQTVHL